MCARFGGFERLLVAVRQVTSAPWMTRVRRMQRELEVRVDLAVHKTHVTLRRPPRPPQRRTARGTTDCKENVERLPAHGLGNSWLMRSQQSASVQLPVGARCGLPCASTLRRNGRCS